MPELSHSAHDRSIVEAQLGRPLRGAWSVARRCHLGVPMVIENHPRLDDGSPFPTLFWLTCPVLVKRIGTIEAGGWMNEINDRLASDTSTRERLAQALVRYKARRDAHEVIEDSGAPPGGGSDRVKCVHAHVAHELAVGGNAVGSAALAHTGYPDCAAACFSAESTA